MNLNWIVVLIVAARSAFGQCECSVLWTGLFANDETSGYDPIVYSQDTIKHLNAQGILRAANGEDLQVYCAQGFKYQTNTVLKIQRCGHDNNFGLIWSFLGCLRPQTALVRRNFKLSDCSIVDEEHWQISLEFGRIPRIKQILFDICFDRQTLSTSSVRYTQEVGSAAVFFQVQRPYDRWNIAQYGAFPIARAYTFRQQLFNLGSLVGPAYFAHNSLQRGHIATFAAGDFYYVRNASCEYINNIPQWATINLGNMHVVESTLARLAASLHTPLKIAHLNMGILRLDGKALYLLPQEQLVVVPQLVLKIFKHPETNRQLVAIVYNNPFLITAPSSFCEEIGATEPWWPQEAFRTGTSKDIINGYVFLCRFERTLLTHLYMNAAKANATYTSVLTSLT